MESINPFNGKSIATYKETAPDEVERRIAAADAAYRVWRNVSFDERSRLLSNVATVLRERRESYADLMAREMGKPLAEGRAEADKCAWVSEYYAENAPRFLAPEPVSADMVESRVTFEPLGVVLAVMPWNFPFWQVFRFAAPALMAGNTAILKHASNVCGCALAIEAAFIEAGLPEGVFQTVLVPGSRVASMIEDRRIRAVTLTGSTPAGRAVASKAGEFLKKTVLELGGSDPYLILDDIDLEKTAADCATARLINSGQSCVSAKRFIVLEAIRERFESLLVKEMAGRKIGDPLEDGVQVGPQARHDLRGELHQQVVTSTNQGAHLLLGGTLPEGDGAMYPPTVLTDVAPGMPAYDEEMFGPVAAVISVSDEAEAIRVANDTIFGLGAAVYTSDAAQAERVVARLEAGACFINGFVRSDPRLPFGGIKDSGYGRELSSFGIREFVNIKTISRIR
jgi:succinate-semialdehyde dehydrogenase/glutarate-semialdehyde dehydrogenase